MTKSYGLAGGTCIHKGVRVLCHGPQIGRCLTGKVAAQAHNQNRTTIIISQQVGVVIWTDTFCLTKSFSMHGRNKVTLLRHLQVRVFCTNLEVNVRSLRTGTRRHLKPADYFAGYLLHRHYT